MARMLVKFIAGDAWAGENASMCGRYALYGPAARVRAVYDLENCPDFPERYNIAPQSRILVIRHKPGIGRVGQLVRWGLIPSWASDAAIGNRLNNARGETVAEKPAFRSSFARHRCLIPANGFYEWQALTVGGKPRKQPWYIHPNVPDEMFAFAGLLAAWKAPAGGVIVSTCIITTMPNAVMAPIHDRMPVILERAQFDAWLDLDNHRTDDLKEMMGPSRAEHMLAHPVSPALNRGDVEGPQCIAPLEA